MNINNNINSLRQKVPAGCKLVAVSKTQPVERIIEAYNAGHRMFGENKVQELVTKQAALPQDIEWHMIGHLQTNKVKQIVAFVSLIHGVDSLKLLEEINKQGQKSGRVVPCLLQMFIAREETKFGFDEREILEMIDSGKISAMSHIRISGLMGMATFTDDKEAVRSEFRKLRQFFENLKSNHKMPSNMTMTELSMGMSGDFEIAIEEGSTIVRIGTAIFGSRNLN
jgi:PLP dependent protein